MAGRSDLVVACAVAHWQSGLDQRLHVTWSCHAAASLQDSSSTGSQVPWLYDQHFECQDQSCQASMKKSPDQRGQ